MGLSEPTCLISCIYFTQSSIWSTNMQSIYNILNDYGNISNLITRTEI